MYPINERIVSLMKDYANGVPLKFSKMLGHDRPQKMYNIQKHAFEASKEIIDDILRTFPEISPQWLLTGQGEKRISKPFMAVNDNAVYSNIPVANPTDKEALLEENRLLKEELLELNREYRKLIKESK